jgi:nitrogen fixation/metabolism regulation signal transduction histidine kinase
MDMVDEQGSTMKPNMEEILRQRRLTFIGKVLADFTTDCRNHLAVIQKSADWLGERFLEQSGHEVREDQEKFGEILSTITRHVKILTQKNYYLDRFARRIGMTSFTPDPAEIITEVVDFSSRSARRRKVAVTTAIPEPLSVVSQDPGLVYFLVSIIFNDMLERVAGGGNILIQAKSAEKTVMIEVEGYPTQESPGTADDEENRHWSLCRRVVSRFDGRLKTGITSDNKRRTSLFLPMKRTRDT